MLTLAIPVASILSVVLLVLALFRSKERTEMLLGAVTFATKAAVFAILATGAEHIIAHGATAGTQIGLGQKEMILREGYADGIPRLLFVSVVLLLVAGGSALALRARWARLLTIALAALCFAPMAWLGTRGIGLHDRMMRESFAMVGTTEDGCLELSGAVRRAGGMDAAVGYEPRSRELARQCVASWLVDLERGGEAAARLERNAQAAHALRSLSGATALDFVAESNLLVNDEQRREVARRRTATASATP